MRDNYQIEKSLVYHRMHPGVSARQHFQTLQAKLARELEGKKRIYLDTKYWVLLRDALLNRPKAPIHAEILSSLRRLVSDGVAICPISDAAYIEVMQQTDVETRLATAQLMDELSCGIAIVTESTRLRLELLNFVHSPATDASAFYSKLWVKTGFVLGERLPYVKQFDFETNQILHKSLIDTLWDQSVADFAQQNCDRNLTSIQDSADRINLKMDAYADEIRSFKKSVDSELSGYVHLFNYELAKAALTQKGHPNAPDEIVKEFQEAIQTCLSNLARLKPDLLAKRVPTLFILAMCHGAIRWDKQRKLDRNWLIDLHHACAGVAYHDVMLTEKALKTLLTSGNTRIDKRLGCAVFATEPEILRHLTKMLDSDSAT